ncbi:hypothetical protein [Rathayibacter tanaceti]|uniref:Uncharacterized protein n=2 Tax=Rathayibacter tanaceti TaxID=1671680 RepID=A0A168GBR6_9MICO|nr:hypothetical protein [Rathayibacter tanaceti]KZX22825.1 hypothetical protein ACH61_00045 [Rathayibacter tanaceti]QHC55506.1 hypothetical protein GSU10_07530 [Rathayibacter tanaceti]TCO39719.1 hypothetical protein EV639_101675 [Rathayibacter tanaceti]
MPMGEGDLRSTARVLSALAAAFDDPGAAHPGLARRVSADARGLLHQLEHARER